MNQPFLVGDLSVPAIEGKLDQSRPGIQAGAAFPGRQAQHGRFGNVIIHDQVERRGPVTASQAVESEIFDPDAGMKHFRLMARKNERIGIGLGDGLSGGLQIGAGFCADGLPGLAAQIGQGSAEKNQVGRGKSEAVVGQHVARFGERGLGDDTAIVRGRPQTLGKAHRQGPRRHDEPSSSAHGPCSSARAAAMMRR